MTAYEIMQSAQVPDSITEERLALADALAALRSVRPSNGTTAAHIAAVKRRIVRVLASTRIAA